MTAEPAWGLSRDASLAIGVALFLVIVVVATGNFCVDVLLQGMGDGVTLVMWLAAAFGYGGIVLRRAGDTPAGLRRVSAVALGLGIFGLIAASLGFAGLLSKYTVMAVVAGGLGLAAVSMRHRSLREFRPWLSARSPAANVAWLWAVPIAIGFVAASMAPGFLWKPLDPHPYDVLSYHLQIPREWYDAGRIIPLRHNSFSFFPMGMETHFLTAMHADGGPWAGMYLCQFVSLAHGVLAALAVTAVCRAMRVGPVVSSLAGIATFSVPWVLMLSSVCYVESGVMLYTLLAAAWAVRAAARDQDDQDAAAQAADRTVDEANLAPESAARAAASVDPSIHGNRAIPAMALAGAFAGFACGMKYTAVAMTAAPLLVLWPLVAWRTTNKRRLAVSWLAAAAACGLVFSPWLIRNAVTTGNPVFPLATKIFGPGHFTPDQIDRYQTAHSPPPVERSLPARLGVAWRAVVLDPQYGYVLIPAAVVAAGVLLARRQTDTLLPTLMLAAMSGVWLLATHLLPRFLTPAIPLAVVLVAAAIARTSKGGLWVGIPVGAASIVYGLVFTWQSVTPALAMGREAGLFRMPDLTAFETDDIKTARESGRKIVLVGDAQAFLYGVPSDRLVYRGVFDVVVPPGVDLADGWTSRSIDDWRREGCWVVVNIPELDRLSSTYAHLPQSALPFFRQWRLSGRPQVVLPPLQ